MIGCFSQVEIVKIGGSVEPFGLGPLYILIMWRGLQVWEIARTLQSYEREGDRRTHEREKR